MLVTVGLSVIVGVVGSVFQYFRGSKSQLGKYILSTFEQLQLGIPIKLGNGTEKLLLPRITAEYTHPWGTRLLLNLPVGLTSEQVRDKQAAICEALKREVDIQWNDGLVLDVFNEPLPTSVEYEYKPRKDWRVQIGINQRGEPVWYDFNGSFPHLLIAGIPGSGKSVVVRGILTSLILNQHEHVELYLSDLKGGVELGLFRNLHCVNGFARSIKELYDITSQVERLMMKRYEVMYERNIRKWDGDRIVLVMDELADLKTGDNGDPDRKVKSAIKSKLRLIAAKGRAAGVILVLSTQRPSVDVVEGTIRTNIDTAICFRTRDTIQSRTILDNELAADLPPVPGRAIYQQNVEQTIQALYLDDDEAERILSAVPTKSEVTKANVPSAHQRRTEAITDTSGVIRLG